MRKGTILGLVTGLAGGVFALGYYVGRHADDYLLDDYDFDDDWDDDDEDDSDEDFSRSELFDADDEDDSDEDFSRSELFDEDDEDDSEEEFGGNLEKLFEEEEPFDENKDY